ncbi:MAG: hypothetical protein ACOYMX_01460 [Burkholderiales bacterium]|jgi:hypothetical protein
MQNEVMQMVLDSLLEFQEQTSDERFQDCIDGLQAVLSKPKRPMTTDQARDLYKNLPTNWRPHDFVLLVEKFHGIK